MPVLHVNMIKWIKIGLVAIDAQVEITSHPNNDEEITQLAIIFGGLYSKCNL